MTADQKATPPLSGNRYVCPNCELVIPTRALWTLAKPPRYAHLLNDIIKCPNCNFMFSYKPIHLTTVSEGGEVKGTVLRG